MMYMRFKGPATMSRTFAPKTADHPTHGEVCPACGELLEVGETTVLIPLGPGADPESRERCAAGGWYNAIAIEVHSKCAGAPSVVAGTQRAI